MKKLIFTTLFLSILFFLGEASFGTGAAQARRDGTEWIHSANSKGGHTAMPAKPDRFMKFAELVKSARMKSGGVVSEQHRQSLPIPVLKTGSLLIAFLYCPALALPGQPVKMSPPQYLALLRPDTGSLVELKSVTPHDFRQSHQPNEMIGTFALPEHMTVEDFMVRLDRLYGLYDMLLPEFALGKAKVDSRTKAAAGEFNALFQLLSEPSLKPYYRSLGTEYFKWVDAIAR